MMPGDAGTMVGDDAGTMVGDDAGMMVADAGTMVGDAGMMSGDVGLSRDAGNADAARDAAAGDASTDGGDAGEPASPSNSCGCAIPGGRMIDRGAVLALLTVLGVIASRRRPRR